MPTARATSISSLVSIVKVVMPSTSDGWMPASASAARHGFGGELQLRATRVLRELGLADADDRGLVLQRDRHHAAPFGSASRTVPVTWLPQPFLPATSTTSSPAASSLLFTLPTIFIVSPGRFGAPSLIATFFTTASGPGPVGDVATDEPVGGEDVHEHVAHALRLRGGLVVVDGREVARRERAADHQRHRDRDRQLGQRVADLHRLEAQCLHTSSLRSASLASVAAETHELRRRRAERQLDRLRPEEVAVDRVVDVRRRGRRAGAARCSRCASRRRPPRTSRPPSRASRPGPRRAGTPRATPSSASPAGRSSSRRRGAARSGTSRSARRTATRSLQVPRGDLERALGDADLRRAERRERARRGASARRRRRTSRRRRADRRRRRARRRASSSKSGSPRRGALRGERDARGVRIDEEDARRRRRVVARNEDARRASRRGHETLRAVEDPRAPSRRARVAGCATSSEPASTSAALRIASPRRERAQPAIALRVAAEARDRQTAEHQRREHGNRRHRAADLFEQRADFEQAEAHAALRFGHRDAEQVRLGERLPERDVDAVGASPRPPSADRATAPARGCRARDRGSCSVRRWDGSPSRATCTG